MPSFRLLLMLASFAPLALSAQACDPSIAPDGLSSTYTAGTGVHLQWNAIPGSIGVQLRAATPDGAVVKKRLFGAELDQFFVPADALSEGVFAWQIQAVCSTIPPYSVTMPSSVDTFFIDYSSTCSPTMTDVDGNVYATSWISGQCWMAENLKTSRYRNGDSIRTATSDAVWSSTPEGQYAVYAGLDSLSAIYGNLYNWHATNDNRGLCPVGWHVPTEDDWQILAFSLVSGGSLKETGTLAAGSGLWEAPNTGATNSTGFSARPAGVRNSTGGYSLLGTQAYFWTAIATGPATASYRRLDYDSSSLTYWTGALMQTGFSVRCIKNY